jgi:hypothetical protein
MILFYLLTSEKEEMRTGSPPPGILAEGKAEEEGNFLRG